MLDDTDKKKALKIISGFPGVDATDISLKENKVTVTGAIDPVELVGKLRKKAFWAAIISVGPAKEAQKKDDNRKDGQDKEDNKSNKNKQSKDPKFDPGKCYSLPYTYYQPPPPLPPYFYGRNISVEEDPNSCVIC